MNQTKLNIFSNFGGKAVTSVLSLIFVPIYLHYLSVEAYGIIGFFAGLQSVLFLLDVGLSPAMSRELARLSAFPEKAQQMRDLSRTLEVICWSMAFVVGTIALFIAPLIAKYWLQSEQLSTGTISEALMLMSGSLVFQWVLNLYAGGMMGLQKQVQQNILNITGAIFRSVGAFFVLAFYSPTIQAFLTWQVISGLILVIMTVIAFWKSLPSTGEKPKFRFSLLKNIWRYAAGITSIGVVTLVLTQSDKIVLSRLLTLEYFGYYTLATTLAGMSLRTVTNSISSAYFPRFSQYAARGDESELRAIYHRSCQVMSVFLIPAALVLVFFSYEILLVWTRNPEIAGNTYLLLTIIAAGTGINGLMHLPYFMQLAHGVTKITFWQNVTAIILLIPFMIFMTFRFGAVGGAVSWLTLNSLYVLVGMQVMNRFVLRGELMTWYLRDVIPPLFLSLLIISLWRVFYFETSDKALIFVQLAAAFSSAMIALIFSNQFLRTVFMQTLNAFFKKTKIYGN